MNSSAFN